MCVCVYFNAFSYIKQISNDLFIFENLVALAVALGNLYRDETEAEMNDIECVLAAASILHFKPLVDW